MSEGIESEPKLPRYQQEVEALLDAKLAPDDVAPPLEPDSIRGIAYTWVLRMIAANRHQERIEARKDPNYYGATWTNAWELTPNRELLIKFEHKEVLDTLSAHLEIANDVRRFRALPMAESDNPVRRNFQQAVRERMWQYVERPGRNRSPIEDHEVFSRIKGDSLAIVAPPGAGKTRLQAEFLRATGIGEPLYEESDQRRRALVVLPTQFMLDQYAGKIGEDEFGTALGENVSRGAIWEYSKQSDADVTFVIASSIPQLLEKGHLDFTNYHTTIVDEGHFALDGELLEHLRMAGPKLLFFTATPAKNELRDLRRYFQYVEEGTLREFVEGGILNRTRLFSYFANEGKEADMAAELATQLVRMGRKVAVFCQRRNPKADNAQTNFIVDYVNEHIPASNADSPVAHVLGTQNGRKKNEQVLSSYVAGAIRCVATVQMLGEGHNDPDLDAVILIGPNFEYEAIQKAGRCLRRSEKESFIIEILGRLGSDDARMQYSIWQAFGFDSIVQGAGVGFGNAEGVLNFQGFEIRSTVLASFIPLQFQNKPFKSGVRTPSSGSKQNYRVASLDNQRINNTKEAELTKVADVNKQNLPILNAPGAGLSPNAPDPELIEALALPAEFGYTPGVAPVRTGLFEDRERSEGKKMFLRNAIAANVLCDEFTVPGFWLQHTLDRAEVPFEMSETDGVYRRHYAQKAKEVLAANEAVAEPEQRIFTRKAILNTYGISKRCLEQVENAMGLDPASDRKFSLRELARIEEEFTSYPIADSGYIPLPALRKEFVATEKKPFFVNRYLEEHPETEVVEMRCSSAAGFSTPLPHVTVEAADVIHGAYEDLDLATDEHISVTQIAQLAGVSIATVASRVDTDYKTQKRLLRSPSHRKIGTYLPLKHAHDLIDEIMPEKLPPTHIPLVAAMKRLGVTKKLPATYARSKHDRVKKINIGPPYGEVSCIEWSLLQELEERFPLKPGVDQLDYALLKSRTTRGKEYAQRVQGAYIERDKLVELNDMWISIDDVIYHTKATLQGFSVLLSIVAGNPKELINNKDHTIHRELADRAIRHHVEVAPEGWISHEKLLERLAMNGAAFPKNVNLEQGDRRLCRGQSTGILDAYYTPQAARSVEAVAAGQKRQALPPGAFDGKDNDEPRGRYRQPKQ